MSPCLKHLRNRGMATSAATHQHFFTTAKVGHVLDPHSVA